MSVTLRPAEERDRALIKNIFNLYQNDLSEYCDDFKSLDSDGYFDQDASKDVLPCGDGVYPFIIAEEGRNIGFVMCTDARYSPEGCDWCLEEMYLIRPARGRGLAANAVREVFRSRPGMWYMCVYERNAPARRFWDRVIASCGTKISETVGENGMLDIVFTVNMST